MQYCSITDGSRFSILNRESLTGRTELGPAEAVYSDYLSAPGTTCARLVKNYREVYDNVRIDILKDGTYTSESGVTGVFYARLSYDDNGQTSSVETRHTRLYFDEPSNPYSITTMQEMTPEICATMNVEQYLTLIDSRDGKSYQIRKLADGQCWMMQNLALEGGTLLTPEDSNVTENYTLPESSLESFTASSDNASLVAMYNGTYLNNTNNNWYSENDSNTGAYYTYDAVIRDTGDICPKNWSIPYSYGLSESSSPSFSYLTQAYNNDVSKMKNAGWNFGSAGYLTNEGFVGRDLAANEPLSAKIMTRDPGKTALMYSAASPYQYTYVDINRDQSEGLSVRCAVKGPRVRENANSLISGLSIRYAYTTSVIFGVENIDLTDDAELYTQTVRDTINRSEVTIDDPAFKVIPRLNPADYTERTSITNTAIHYLKIGNMYTHIQTIVDKHRYFVASASKFSDDEIKKSLERNATNYFPRTWEVTSVVAEPNHPSAASIGRPDNSEVAWLSSTAKSFLGLDTDKDVRFSTTRFVINYANGAGKEGSQEIFALILDDDDYSNYRTSQKIMKINEGDNGDQYEVSLLEAPAGSIDSDANFYASPYYCKYHLPGDLLNNNESLNECYDLRITSNRQSVNYTTFPDGVTLYLALRNEVDPRTRLVARYIADDGSMPEADIPVELVTATGVQYAKFTVDHFSTYAIVTVPETTPQPSYTPTYGPTVSVVDPTDEEDTNRDDGTKEDGIDVTAPDSGNLFGGIASGKVDSNFVMVAIVSALVGILTYGGCKWALRKTRSRR